MKGVSYVMNSISEMVKYFLAKILAKVYVDMCNFTL